jgi:hypothetical protein
MTDEMILKKAIEQAVSHGFCVGEDARVIDVIQKDLQSPEPPYDRYWILWHTKEGEFCYAEFDCYEQIIFNHDFAKAFFGTELLRNFYEEYVENEAFGGKLYYPYLEGAEITWTGEAWIYHLQQMVLEKNPLKYLEQYLGE